MKQIKWESYLTSNWKFEKLSFDTPEKKYREVGIANFSVSGAYTDTRWIEGELPFDAPKSVEKLLKAKQTFHGSWAVNESDKKVVIEITMSKMDNGAVINTVLNALMIPLGGSDLFYWALQKFAGAWETLEIESYSSDQFRCKVLSHEKYLRKLSKYIPRIMDDMEIRLWTRIK